MEAVSFCLVFIKRNRLCWGDHESHMRMRDLNRVYLFCDFGRECICSRQLCLCESWRESSFRD